MVEIQFDVDDRLRDYTLNKRTCGAEIGSQSLILELIARHRPEEILEMSGEDIREHYPVTEQDEFLYAKHLVALQEASRVLLGRAAGAPDDACTAAAVGYDQGVTFRGYVAIGALVDKIKACGNCGRCGSRRRRRPKPS